MIFFVLSGFFIAGSAATAVRRGRWSWAEYAVSRLTRLWVVLIPALVLTLILDKGGMWLTNGAGYDGRYHAWILSGPSAAAPPDLSITAFMGNLAFLQTVVTPVFGTNGPLWSLTYEFWYYFLFPFLLQPVHPGSTSGTRAIAVTVVGTAFFLLPGELLWAGLIWLFGYGAYCLASADTSYPFPRTGRFFTISLASLCLFLVLSRFERLPYGDFLIGLAFAGTLPFLTRLKSGGQIYSGVAVHLSNVSYSLYLFHFPIIAFLFYGLLPKPRFQPSLSGYTGYAACLLLLLLISFALWWLFERRTPQVRDRVRRLFKLGRGAGKAR